MNLGQEYEDNLSLFDVRTRNINFVSPEQLQIGQELAEIVSQRNGKIDMDSFEI